MNKSIKTNAVLNIIRTCLTVVFPLIIYPYVSKVLGPENLGKVNFATSVVNYFVLFSSLGIPAYGIIICAKNRSNIDKLKKTVAELLYINIILSIISYLLLFVSSYLIEKFSEYRSLLLINSLSIVFNTIGLEWLYSSLEEYSYITVRSVVVKLVSLPLYFLLIRKSNDYMIYAIIIIASTAGSNIFNFVHARKYLKLFRISELDFRQHFKPVLVFFAASVAGTINANVDTIMLGFVKSDYDVGIYSFAVKIKSLLVQFMTAGLTVMIPRLSKYASNRQFDEYRLLIKKAFIITMFLATMFSVYFSLLSKEIIFVLGGKQYLNAQIPMIILNICIFVLGLTWTFGVGVLQPLGMEKKYTLVMFIATFINLSANSILIPFFGVSGAAMATLLTEVVNAFLFIFFSKGFIGDSLKGSKVWVFILSAFFSGLLTLIIYILFLDGIFSHWIIIIITFIVFILIYLSISVFFHNELRSYFRNIFIKIIGRFIK